MEKSLDELVYALSCECKEAVYSNIEHKEFVPSMTKQEFYSQDVDDITQTYENWLLYESSSWHYHNCGRYFYVEAEVFE